MAGMQPKVDWRQYIESNPDVRSGRPVIKGTRLTVEFLLSLLAAGWTEEQILENYPSLTQDALRAVFAFVAECMSEETMYPLLAESSR